MQQTIVQEIGKGVSPLSNDLVLFLLRKHLEWEKKKDHKLTALFTWKKSPTLDQEIFLRSNALPSSWVYPIGYHEDKAAHCTQLNFVVDDDRPCRQGFEWVRLPDGWGKELTSVSDFIRVYDEFGVTRMFLHVPFGSEDMQAYCLLVPRFLCGITGCEQGILDTQTFVAYTSVGPVSDDLGDGCVVMPAERFLETEFPMWRDISVYWESSMVAS